MQSIAQPIITCASAKLRSSARACSHSPIARAANRDFAEYLIVRRSRDADTPRFGDTLETCCDIDAITKDVMSFNDNIADIDANAKGETLVFSVANRKVMDAFLELHCGPNRLDRTSKFCQ
jgi:hypothetical protein